METYYRRHLPHYQPTGATYFITFRLASSLPAEVIKGLVEDCEERDGKMPASRNKPQPVNEMLRTRKSYFERFDSFLDQASTGPRWLQQAQIAEIVREAIHFREGLEYDLYAYCAMPNHVHTVFELLSKGAVSIGGRAATKNSERNKSSLPYPVTRILASLKKHTALGANRKLRRQGAFWQDESYDHVVRDGEDLERILWYVIFNPEKVGLVKSWKDWKWTYCKPGLLWLEAGSLTDKM
jgi:REP element-mobilizing transposase RayT